MTTTPTPIIGGDLWDGTPAPDDIWFVSASTVPDVLAAPGLERWKVRRIASEVVANLGLVTQLAATNPDAAEKWVQDSVWNRPAGELLARDRGTWTHSWFEHRTTGAPAPAMPSGAEAQLVPYANAIDAWLAANPMTVLDAEQVVYHPERQLAGRFDVKADLASAPGGHRRWLLDLKSADEPKKVYGTEHALQMAIYRYATHQATWTPRQTKTVGGGRAYLANVHELALATAPVEVEACGILQVTPVGCRLAQLHVNEATFAYACVVADAWRWAKLVAPSVVGGVVA